MKDTDLEKIAAEYLIGGDEFTNWETTENISLSMYFLSYWWAFYLGIYHYNDKLPTNLAAYNDNIQLFGSKSAMWAGLHGDSSSPLHVESATADGLGLRDGFR